MNKKEVIAQLESLKAHCSYYTPVEALEIAINVLKKEVVQEVPVQEQPSLINITSNKQLNVQIATFLLSYVTYVQDQIKNAIDGKEVDEKAIYALGDAVRIMNHIRKLMETSKA